MATKGNRYRLLMDANNPDTGTRFNLGTVVVALENSFNPYIVPEWEHTGSYVKGKFVLGYESSQVTCVTDYNLMPLDLEEYYIWNVKYWR